MQKDHILPHHHTIEALAPNTSNSLVSLCPSSSFLTTSHPIIVAFEQPAPNSPISLCPSLCTMKIEEFGAPGLEMHAIHGVWFDGIVAFFLFFMLPQPPPSTKIQNFFSSTSPLPPKLIFWAQEATFRSLPQPFEREKKITPLTTTLPHPMFHLMRRMVSFHHLPPSWSREMPAFGVSETRAVCNGAWLCTWLCVFSVWCS